MPPASMVLKRPLRARSATTIGVSACGVPSSARNGAMAIGIWFAPLPTISIVSAAWALPAANKAEAGGLEKLDGRSVHVQFLDHTDQVFADNVVTPPQHSSRAPMIVAAILVLVVLAVAGFLLIPSRGPSGTAPSTTATDELTAPSSIASAPAGSVVVREVRSTTNKCYGGDRPETEHTAPTGGEVAQSGPGRLCRLEVVSGNAQYAYLVARNGTTMPPTDLGARGSLAPKIITEESVLEVVFSAEPLQAGADVSRLPRIVIRIGRS